MGACRLRRLISAAEIRAPLTADGARGRLGRCWPGRIPGAVCQGVTLNHASIVDQGCAGTLVPGGASMAAGGKMMNWSGLNIPLMAVLVCCWAGIPLWHVLTRWGAEFKAKHAEVAARAVAVPVLVQPAPVPAARGAGSLACAGVAERCGKGRPGFGLGRPGRGGGYGSGFLHSGTPDTGAPSRRKPGSSPAGMRVQGTSPARPATAWSRSRRGSL